MFFIIVLNSILFNNFEMQLNDVILAIVSLLSIMLIVLVCNTIFTHIQHRRSEPIKETHSVDDIQYESSSSYDSEHKAISGGGFTDDIDEQIRNNPHAHERHVKITLFEMRMPKFENEIPSEPIENRERIVEIIDEKPLETPEIKMISVTKEEESAPEEKDYLKENIDDYLENGNNNIRNMLYEDYNDIDIDMFLEDEEEELMVTINDDYQDYNTCESSESL